MKRLRPIVRDLGARPAVAVLVVIAIAFAAATGGVGAGLAAQLVASTGSLLDRAGAPDLVQMHAGAVDQSEVESFARSQPDITAWSVHELVGIDAAALFLTPERSEADRAVEFAATVQHDDMDALLGLDGRPAAVEPGGIGIPLDLADDRGIGVGDVVTIGAGDTASTFTVTTLFRDSIMNSSLASSRRLLVADADLDALRAVGTGSEWLIGFALADAARAPQVHDAYLAAGLPADGPSLDRAAFELMTGLTDGLGAAAILVLAGLVTLIAALMLGITVQTTIAARRRQIGVLRAIGLPRGRLRRLVLRPPSVLIGFGAAVGAVAGLVVTPLVTDPLRQRLGGDPTPMAVVAVIVFAALTALVGIALAHLAATPALRRPPLDVMRDAPTRRRMRVGRARRIRPAWLSLARAELTRSPGAHAAIAGVVAATTLVAALPLALATTLAAPGFVTTTGVAVSDLRIDLRHDDGLAGRLAEVEEALGGDPRVARSTTLVTSRVPVMDDSGRETGINVESGDHTAFPLDYGEGRPPVDAGELALSELNASALEAVVGDEVVLRLGDEAVAHTVVGVYRDMTNGGRTAKAVLPSGAGDPMWTVVLADAAPDADIGGLVAEYAELAAPARVTDVAAARADLLGPVERTAASLAMAGVAGSAALTAVLSVLMLRLVAVRASRRRSVMQAIGASLESRRAATTAQFLLPGVCGAIVGVALTPALGGGLLGAAGAVLGASSLALDGGAAVHTIAVTLLLVAVVAALAWFGVRRVGPSEVARSLSRNDL